AGGRLWCSDSDHLFAFELDGELRESFGGRIAPDELQAIEKAAIDANGNIGLVDARTQRLHGVAATGEPLAKPSDSWDVSGEDWRELLERPTPGWRHDEGRNSVKKLDARGAVDLVVERRADRRFFTVVRAIAVGR